MNKLKYFFYSKWFNIKFEIDYLKNVNFAHLDRKHCKY